jgi:ABC-2 type transport system permease protein
MNTHYLRLEIVRILRDPKYLALAVLAPIGFYLLFATIFGGGPTPPGELPARTEIMVAMAAYGGIWAVLSTTGPRIAEERQVGWFDQLRTMPVRAWRVLSAKVAASVLMALPAIVLVCATAAVVKGVELTTGQWVALVCSMWAGTIVFSSMGIAIGYAVGSDVAYALSYGLYTAMSALGGLFAPPAVLPDGMLAVARALPSYQLANLGWHIAAGTAPAPSSVLVLVAWTLGFAVIALVAYRRPTLAELTRTRKHADKLAV